MAKKAKILVVDDDTTVREGLVRALGIENYEVVAAGCGQEALREFTGRQIDIALLDVNLGEESGWDLFRRLIEIDPSLAVIIMSGRPQLDGETRFLGAEALLEKPLNLPALFQKLSELAAEAPEQRVKRQQVREWCSQELAQ